ncbi:hypothetical protein B0H67DRAFT_368375 [Lasiosphaeris hirsuta]|uniref:Uncharacterized protein n=1 Tax=Lasiosphaeris hirsuta TaxID=260670 RepID=A0AA40DJ25_9PEZI|nr:hypothetical protein B0H67DRAFT_368375 [Lasiosphaeris hirsuta]
MIFPPGLAGSTINSKVKNRYKMPLQRHGQESGVRLFVTGSSVRPGPPGASFPDVSVVQSVGHSTTNRLLVQSGSWKGGRRRGEGVRESRERGSSACQTPFRQHLMSLIVTVYQVGCMLHDRTGCTDSGQPAKRPDLRGLSQQRLGTQGHKWHGKHPMPHTPAAAAQLVYIQGPGLGLNAPAHWSASNRGNKKKEVPVRRFTTLH